jgi:hypothetical protein
MPQGGRDFPGGVTNAPGVLGLPQRRQERLRDTRITPGHYKCPRGARIVRRIINTPEVPGLPRASQTSQGCQDCPGGLTNAPVVPGLPRGHHQCPRGTRISPGASRRSQGCQLLHRLTTLESQLIVIESTKYALRVAYPWMADEQAAGWLP